MIDFCPDERNTQVQEGQLNYFILKMWRSKWSYKKRITDKKNDKIKKNKIDFWKKFLKLTFLNEKRIIW